MTSAAGMNDRYKWTALWITSLSTLVGVLNASTLIIALPTILVDLHTTLFGVMWVLIVYLLIATILAPAWGRVADMYGRKNLYLFGLAVFIAGSLLCSISADITQLILFRVVQAIGGSLLISNGSAIVADAFPLYELGKAMGVLSMIIAAAFAAGPIVGGILTVFDWRWNFYVNIPIGVIALVWGYYRLQEPVEIKQGEQFDYTGMVLFTVSFIALIIYISLGAIEGFAAPIMLGLLAVGIVTLYAFLHQERRTPYPLIDISVFKIRIFSFGQVSAFLNSIARGAVLVLLILFFQGPRGMDPLTASIFILPVAVGLAITGPIGGILSDTYGSRIISTLGLGISFVGLLGLATLHYDTPYPIIAVWMLVNSVGSGLFQAPNTSAIMGAVAPLRRGFASSMRVLLMNAGNVISMSIALPLILGTVTLEEITDMFIMGGAMLPVSVQEAFTLGITHAFLLSAIITVPAIILSALRGTEQRQKKTPEPYTV
ncbi:MAG: MFS transporter [Methanomicrobiales archaeon]|nr:MFS transporter [Methanomicrobiales archaeon]